MAKLADSKYQSFYAAAALVVERVFRSGDSLFTPGKPVWTAENRAEFHRRFVENAMEGSELDHFEKLREQFSGATSGLVQMAAELDYIFWLPVSGDITEQTKRSRIDAICSLADPPVPRPFGRLGGGSRPRDRAAGHAIHDPQWPYEDGAVGHY